MSYKVLETEHGAPIKAWIEGVALESAAEQQLRNVARLPFIHKHVAAMPDVHWGLGATVGSVIATRGAVIPAAVGVDIGCGMMAARTNLTANDLPDSLADLRTAIEQAVPHGRTQHGGPGDRGAWGEPPAQQLRAWVRLQVGLKSIVEKHPRVVGRHATATSNTACHLGTLGTGNHFVEVCLDEQDAVWFMLHSGSRGIGNRIGSYFIELAKDDMGGGTSTCRTRTWPISRKGPSTSTSTSRPSAGRRTSPPRIAALMMEAIVRAAGDSGLPITDASVEAINCHHNYVTRENHFGANVLVTRKGAVRARQGDLGIIPGSMGARSYIVRGKGNPDSFMSCSHGAGRAMSRNEARRRFTLEDHAAATAGVECRKDSGVIDETPGAYKPIDAVMAAQTDLVEVVHELHQLVCVKG